MKKGRINTPMTGKTVGKCTMMQDTFNYHSTWNNLFWDTDMNNLQRNVDMTVEKWLVLTTSGVLKGTFEKEKGASQYIQKQVKENPNTRYILARAEKEVGAKSPEIEIEDIA